MDLCDLVPNLNVPAVHCTSKPVCSPSEDGSKMLCVSSGLPSTSCIKLPAPMYRCRREDGTSYDWFEERDRK